MVTNHCYKWWRRLSNEQLRKWVMLINIFSSLGKDLKEYPWLLDKYLNGVIEESMLLPFFPSLEMRGFWLQATYTVVESCLWEWEEIENSEKRKKPILSDVWFMIIIFSRESNILRRFLKKITTQSKYRIFVYFAIHEFFPEGKTYVKQIVDLDL